MNKELTPLQAFENIVVDLTPHLKNANTEEIKIVETELKDAEENKKIVYILKYKLGMIFNTKGIYRLVEKGVLSQEEYDLLNRVFDYE